MINHRDIIQGSEEWLTLRKGKISGKKLRKVKWNRQVDFELEIIAERATKDEETLSGIEKMQRGLDLEPWAIDAYEKRTGLKILSSGFWESEELEIGVSPDGYTEHEDGTITHAIEIKCLDTKNHLKCIKEGNIPKENLDQVYMYFLVNEGLTTLDFISFDPRYKKLPMYVIRVYRENIGGILMDAKNRLNKFLSNVAILENNLQEIHEQTLLDLNTISTLNN